MATTATFSGNYAGEKARGYISAAVLEANTISQGVVTLWENTKYRWNIRNLTASVTVADSTCAAPDAGTVTLADVVLEPKELMSGITLCKTDFLDQWEAMQLSGNVVSESMPMEFVDFLSANYLAKIAKTNDNLIWNGVDGAGETDGLLTRIKAAAANNLTNAVLTSSTILTALDAVYQAAAGLEYGLDEGTIYIGKKAYAAYQTALGFGQLGASTHINSYNNQLVVGEKPLEFNGIKMVVINAFPVDTILYARKEDLHVGVNLLSDLNEFQIIDKAPIDGSRNFTMQVRWRIGTQITNRGDMILSNTTPQP